MKGIVAVLAGGVALAGLVGFLVPVDPQHENGVKFGALRCHEASGWALALGSSRDPDCVIGGAAKGAMPVK